MNINYKITPLLIYIAKAVTGAVIVFTLSAVLKYPDVNWCLISVVLVLSPESKEAIPLALTRIKANVSGGLVSLFCILLGQPNVYTISLAFILTISFCYLFKVMAGSRSALAAVIIIMLHKEGHDYILWVTVLERVISVIAGCILGLAITYAFHRNFGKAPEILPQSDE